ncbi:uracil-DNA glycosylase [Deinococcus maricopensis]|uniref:Type-4 uracil-DNA glycosylase n=1 Tax=Deinococcus maricopensis (strain DSM 21211 / LMG 22137 / NRRL B-23946 / LB-34) TaxID=709986 RepID=E8U9Y5_DEIML|nr:uracil-DNA glycosylase [Deinococcus maricopensis]ADV67874.1 phage SPO1 DNA polymerase-related protein [Deinococcus maricopensis DSM 21211]
MTRRRAIADLEATARGCTACRLRATCTQVVVADGNPDAPLLILGEGPGGDEDRLGRPFVGRAGQLLDKILGAVGLTRDDAYISNIVKCRPPANRTPEPDEIEVCTRLWLSGQLALLRPRVIVTLGNVPTQYMLGTRTGITRTRGQWYTYAQAERLWTAPLLPMFHPAYLLRNDTRAPGGPKSLTWRDIQAVKAALDGAPTPDANERPPDAAQTRLL